jgi:hypothetical protein
MIRSSALAVCAAAVLGLLQAMPVRAADARTSQASRQEAEKDKRIDSARERCRANRGVDCDSEAGLKEWLLQERSRAEAVKEGSRHLPARTR